MITKAERDELRKRSRVAARQSHDQMAVYVSDVVAVLDALDEALAEKEHYETLAETRGEQRDEAERKLVLSRAARLARLAR